MAHYCDTHEISGLTDEADDLHPATRKHIEECATLLQYSSVVWLPGVLSEDDETLRETLVSDLGSPKPSGYMSEESGWDVTEYVSVREL